MKQATHLSSRSLSTLLGCSDPPDVSREASREGGRGRERLHQLLGRIVAEPPVARQAGRIGDNLRLCLFFILLHLVTTDRIREGHKRVFD